MTHTYCPSCGARDDQDHYRECKARASRKKTVRFAVGVLLAATVCFVLLATVDLLARYFGALAPLAVICISCCLIGFVYAHGSGDDR